MSKTIPNLKSITDRVETFTSHDNRPFLRIPCPANACATRAVPLRSEAFRSWLFGEYWAQFDAVPENQAFHALLHHLQARAFRDADRFGIQVAPRVGSRRWNGLLPADLVLDLASPSGDYVDITPSGWSVQSRDNLPFEPFPTAIPTPTPVQAPGEPLESLRGLIN